MGKEEEDGVKVDSTWTKLKSKSTGEPDPDLMMSEEQVQEVDLTKKNHPEADRTVNPADGSEQSSYWWHINLYFFLNFLLQYAFAFVSLVLQFCVYLANAEVSWLAIMNAGSFLLQLRCTQDGQTSDWLKRGGNFADRGRRPGS